jgi:hypothetical protein
MSDDALERLAPPAPGFGKNRISVAELLFVGNTYVYRGEYPRREGKQKTSNAQRPTSNVELAEEIPTRTHDPSASPITGTGLECDRLTVDERRAVSRRNRGDGHRPPSAGNAEFGRRGGGNRTAYL